jgi:hypothetical protein
MLLHVVLFIASYFWRCLFKLRTSGTQFVIVMSIKLSHVVSLVLVHLFLSGIFSIESIDVSPRTSFYLFVEAVVQFRTSWMSAVGALQIFKHTVTSASSIVTSLGGGVFVSVPREHKEARRSVALQKFYCMRCLYG